MSEKELDSSINDYIETETPKNYVKQLEWDMAIGLQEVDNLKPSKYLEKLLQENVTGEKTIYEVEKELKEYYTEKENNNDVNHNELECDLVSTRIVELLQEDNFELSIDYLKYVHKYLFQDVYEFAGEFRKIDFSKHERILNNDSVAYGDHKLLEQSLDYDITLEKNKNYKNELKDINNNKEFAKAIWDTNDITEAIKTEANNQEKLNNEIDEMLIKERKYNSFEPFIIIILLILCFLGLYFILFTKDSAIINSALTNINNNLTSSLSELNTIKEELNKGITGTATLDTTSSLYASLKDFTYDFSLYNKNNNFYGNIKLSKDDKTINNTYSYLDKNLYIATPLYYFPIQINNPIKVNPLSINYSNLNNNIEVIKNYLTNNITYTSSNKGKEELNGEKLNVLTLDFSEYDFNNSIQKILNAIANDSELLKSIAKDIGLDEVTVNDLFNTNVSFKGNYKIKIYTKGILQTFVGLDIYNDDKEILEYLTDGNTTLNIYGKKKLSINLSNDKFLIYVDDIKLIDIKSNKNKNDLINLDFQVSNILNNYQGSVVLTKFDNNKGSFLFSFKDTNNNDVSAEIKMDLVFGDIKGNEFDYTDAVLIDDITEDELLDIKNNLFNAIWDQVSNPEETVNNNNNNEEPSN